MVKPLKFAEHMKASPGQLYGEIEFSEEVQEEQGHALIKQVDPKFVQYCKRIYSRFPGLGAGGKFKQEYKEAIDFLGWRLRPEEFTAAVKFAAIATLVMGFILGILVFVFFGSLLIGIAGDPVVVMLYIFGPVLILTGYAAYLVQNFPIQAAKDEQFRALTYVPEIMGYMIMSMKLVPNLEKAIEFAAEHGRGKIAEEFRRIIWNVQIGVYNTLTEALDDLAYKWGKYSSEFKQSLISIRSSVLETNESNRYQLLDKTMDEMLESIQGKMEQYARGLSQPSTILFYVGVLLPLILIIILPVGSSFSGSPLARADILFFVYDIMLPLLLLFFAKKVLNQRPSTYTPPHIPDNFPGLPKKGMMMVGKNYISIMLVVGIVAVLGLGGSFFFHTVGIPGILPADNIADEVLKADNKPLNYFDESGPRYNELIGQGFTSERALVEVKKERIQYFSVSERDITAYNLIFGLLITFAFVMFVYLYYNNIYKRQQQLKFMSMESEFKDSLYILASRLGENRPVEEALRHTKDFLPDNAVSKEIFGKTLDNISLLGMSLDAAVFDKNFGALKDKPSSIINSSMKIMIDSVKLGVNVSARTLISLSKQLTNSEKVAKTLNVLIQDITGTMKTMSIFIAPVVLGITTSLQRIVLVTLSSITVGSQDSVVQQQASSNSALGSQFATSFTSTNVSSFIKPEAIAQMATPDVFILLVAIYVIELVIIMNYFTAKLEEENDLVAWINIAKALPISMIVFVLTVIMSNTIVAGGFKIG